MHGLLGLEADCPVTLLPTVPDGPGGEHSALRPLYEASATTTPGRPWHRCSATTGRAGSSAHTPRTSCAIWPCTSARARRRLYPPGAEAEIEGVRRLCELGVDTAAQRAGRVDADAEERAAALGSLLRTLGALEGRLTDADYLLGGQLTAADVELWVSLVQLDTVHRWHLDAAAVHRIADHPRLWAYARALAAHPAFGGLLDLDGIARRHHAHCRGLEAAGAAVQIVDGAGTCLKRRERSRTPAGDTAGGPGRPPVHR